MGNRAWEHWVIASILAAACFAFAGGRRGEPTRADPPFPPGGAAEAAEEPSVPPDVPTFYVSRDGDDAGQRALLKAGAYREWVAFPRSGQAGRPIVLAAQPGESVTVDAGGVGAPPHYFLAQQLSCGERTDCKVAVINGARSRDLLVGVHEFAAVDVDLLFTTDDGTHGLKGIVTDALTLWLERAAGPVHVYTCGPTAMMRAVAGICIARGIPCQVSLETVMPCGLGVCMGCVVKIRDPTSETGFSYLRSCYEGPVFQAKEILWE
jgi:hypothetical protein